jgi:hypothetical protein
MTDNLEIWNDLGRTDPGATKGFKRSGGFSGTAVKPMWILKRLTERFGPAGIGWGVNQPTFETVHASEGEVLVYCTVSTWHGDRANVLWGVGGDKAVGKNKYGLNADDEAFKKAFTDAIGNAFKSIGVAADIQMGLFDDSKYVSAMELEFAPEPEPAATISDDQVGALEILLDATNFPVAEFLSISKITKLTELPAAKFEGAKGWINTQAKKEAA